MGPLTGLRIIEVASLGAGPFCGMMLADMGAEIVRVDRVTGPRSSAAHSPNDPLLRSRKSISLDLSQPGGVEILLELAGTADALFEGFRPGVTERLGFGPEVCLQQNPKLVYGRMTGWGQDGPLSRAAGHDINYIALSGALHAIGRPGEKPVVPLNLVGDFGGGGMLLAFGLVCALFETRQSGKGQVVDAAMLDGSLAQMAMSFGMLANRQFPLEPGSSLMSGIAPFYDTYETADGKYVALGSVEPPFFRQLLELTGIPFEEFGDAGFTSLSGGMNTEKWPELKNRLAAAFKTRSREEWCSIMEGTDACFAPVLTLAEIQDHDHIQYRQSVINIDGVIQNAPAPRFSRTIADTPAPPCRNGQHTDQLLEELGRNPAEIKALRQNGIAS